MARISTELISRGGLTVVSGQYYTSLIDFDTGHVSVDIDSACANLTITDSSNFDIEKGHHRSPHFTTWRKLIVTNPDGTITTYSSIEFGSTAADGSQIAVADGTYYINEADETIINPSDGLDFTIPISGGDGGYNLQLCQVPRWTSGISYNGPSGSVAQQDIVVIESTETILGETWILYSFYRCINSHGANAGNEPSGFGNEYWELVNEDDLALDDGYDKYCDEEGVMIHCALDRCIASISSRILCGDKKIDFCSSDPCCCYDEDYMALLKLYSLRKSMDVIFEYGDSTYIQEIIDVSNAICGCHDADNVVTDPPEHACLERWIQGGPVTGANDAAYAGSSITTGEGTTITNPALYFVLPNTLYTGDVIKMPSGNIWEVVLPTIQCDYGCYDPESSAGMESRHWKLCN